MSEPCPKCGSARTQFEGRTSWECGSYQSLIGGSHIRFPAFRLIESELCTCRQEITRLTAELAAANKFAGDMVQERDDWMKTAAAERIKAIAAQCELAELKRQLSIHNIPGKEDDDGEMH